MGNFKRRITPEQLKELTPEQQVKLWEWWEPELHDVAHCLKDADQYTYIYVGDPIFQMKYVDCLPILDIGQMIELIYEIDPQRLFSVFEYFKNEAQDIKKIQLDTIVKVLWEEVKEILSGMEGTFVPSKVKIF